jgi:hypothetical protein
MPLERAFAIAVFLGERLGLQQLHGCVGAQADRLVQQQGHRLRCGGLGFGVQLDFLGFDLELRLVDDFAIDRDPAAFDEQFGLPTGAADQLDQAFGKASGFRHDGGRKKGGQLLYLPGAG